MRIGIFIGVDRDSGGIFQYTEAVLRALDGWHEDHSWAVVSIGRAPIDRALLEGESKRAVLEGDPSLLTVREEIHRHLSPDGLELDRPGINARARAWLEGVGIDLLIFPAPSAFSFECGIPFVSAIHDIQHRIHPEFPEVSSMGLWYSREYLFRNIVKFAKAVIVDSPTGKEDLVIHYGGLANPDRIHPLPFCPSWNVSGANITKELQGDVLQRYRLPPRFVFMPAQFWAHKNHARLIHAIHILRAREHLGVPLVLTGSHKGEVEAEARQHVYENVVRLAHQLGVQDLVHFLGYIPQEDIPVLYSLARAMVLPTFFGPTNIPVVEAWSLGCPVISSDIRGVRDQVGDAGLLADPMDAESLAKAIKDLWLDDNLWRRLSQKGLERSREFSFSSFRGGLRGILGQVFQDMEGSMGTEGTHVERVTEVGRKAFTMRRERAANGSTNRVLIIQENGRHEENRAFRECFSLQRAFAQLGIKADIWGPGHGSFEIPFHRMDLSPYAAIISLENYDTGWHPDLSTVRTPTVYWCIDAHVDPERLADFVRRNRFDVVFCATAPLVDLFRGICGEAHWLPNAVDPTLIDRRPDASKQWDVGFCGNTLNRGPWLEHLKRRWNLRHDEMVLGDAMVRAVNSYRIHWNRSISVDINYRVFETLGCGTFLLTNAVPCLERLFKVGIHLETYNSLQDMDEKIRFYLQNPEKRELIAQRGYRHARENHTFVERALEMIKAVGLGRSSEEASSLVDGH